MSGSILDIVTAAVAEAAPDAVSMPIADVLDAEVPLGSIGAFGLSGGVGQRRFRTGLEITAGANPIEVRAMFRGLLSDFGLGSSLDFPDRGTQGLSLDRLEAGAWYYVPRSPAVALRVSALGPFRAAIAARPLATVDTGHRAWRHPIELPAPAWVVYEGVGLHVSATVSVIRRETFDRIPVDFPAAGQSWGDWGGGVPTEEVTDLLDDYERRLQDLVELLLGDETHALRAYVIGHTDSTAKEQHNDALSEQRAQMFAAKMQEIAQAFAGVQLDEYQLNLKWRGERQLRYRSDADHPDQRALNRRVEVLVTSGADLEVAASEVIGSATGTLRITVLDETGRFLDPLDVVRRYDQDGRFAAHVLAGHRDPLAPAIASGWVHCVTPAGTAGDAVADPRDTQYFDFHPLDPSDENPLVAVLDGNQLGGVQPADVIWLAGVDSVHATLEMETPVTLVGTSASGNVLLNPTDPDDPIVTIEDPVPSGIGFRILGLTLMNGRADTGGAAIRMVGPDEGTPAEHERRARTGEPPLPPQNIHVAGCMFVNNRPGSGENGGAIHARQCTNVLIEDCRFELNEAAEGGAIFASECTNVVVGGRPLAPADEVTFASLILDADSLVDPSAAALDLTRYGSRFKRNRGRDSGGAIAFDKSTFEIAGCAFLENTSDDGMGGAVVATLDEPGARAAAKNALAQSAPDAMPRARNRITHCLAKENQAGTSGGAFAVLGLGACHVRENVVYSNYAPDGRGGGLMLAAAAVLCWRNRIDSNYAHASGGGVACIDQAHVRLAQNLIFRNGVQPMSGSLSDEDPVVLMGTHQGGMRGGGGLDARGFSSEDRTTVWIAGGNWVSENASAADGGGILAVSGARVVCGWTFPDVFDGNRAEWSGGGVAARNADLEVHGGVQFLSNQAMRGYGGGVFFGGTTMYGAPQPLVILEADAVAGVPGDLPSERGARLTIQGTAGAPVHFGSNQATHGDIEGRDVGGVGAALFIVQQPASPLPDSPPVPALTERVVQRSIGLVRRVSVQGIQCVANLSDDGNPGRSVTIVVQGLEHRWIAEYDLYLRLEAARDSWIGRRPDGAYDLGPYEVRDVAFESEPGDGIWLVQSIDKVGYSGIAPDRLVDRSPPVPLHP